MIYPLAKRNILSKKYPTILNYALTCSLLLNLYSSPLFSQIIETETDLTPETVRESHLSSALPPSFEELENKFSQINLSPPELDFTRFYGRQIVKNENTSNKAIFEFFALEKQFRSINFCESIAVAEMATTAKIAQERAKLMNEESTGSRTYQGSFQSFNNGKLLYKHWLQSWLMSDTSIEELESIAKLELIQVQFLRQKLNNDNLKVNHREFHAKENDKIIAEFKKREQTVSHYLLEYFGYPPPANSLKIIPSSLPKSFPAPGIYNTSTREFIYHLQTETLPEQYMDWLFLHEGLPGHHYQSQIASYSPLCPSMESLSPSSIFSEGWAAYVETIGDDLGLYKDKSSRAYALDWQALRAVRVILDIGIHYHGWSDDKARQVWMKHIPKQKPIMEREITRIHNWPAQVITYVYGKSRIEKSIAELKNKGYLIAEIHQSILSLSNFSLNSLDFLERVLIERNRQQRKEYHNNAK